MTEKSKLALVIQIVLGLLLIVAIVWYIGLHDISQVIFSINGIFLIYASIAYFIVNLLFSIRLKHVIKASRYKVSLKKVLPIQYGGMLASDFTPARSGYFVVPVMLTSENVPVTVGLSSILGIQSIEFLIKMIGGILAIVYLISMVNLSMNLFVLSVIGVTLMFIGAVIIFLAMWWKNAADILIFFKRFPVINRIVGFITPKIRKFQNEARNIRTVIMPILLLTLLSWIFKGLEWYLIGLSLNIDQISFLGFFLLHPLITALSFVPITPSGIGFQEGATVGVLYLLGVSPEVGIVFALLARFLLIIQDVVGIPSLSRAGVKIFDFISSGKID
jgi:uncharacterized protein (TIRG00374 family)